MGRLATGIDGLRAGFEGESGTFSPDDVQKSKELKLMYDSSFAGRLLYGEGDLEFILCCLVSLSIDSTKTGANTHQN